MPEQPRGSEADRTGHRPDTRLITREYICLQCGTVRKATAHYVPGGPAGPICCKERMRMLYYEQAVACTRMSKRKRVEWMMSGGKVEERGGKRRWKAVW